MNRTPKTDENTQQIKLFFLDLMIYYLIDWFELIFCCKWKCFYFVFRWKFILIKIAVLSLLFVPSSRFFFFSLLFCPVLCFYSIQFWFMHMYCSNANTQIFSCIWMNLCCCWWLEECTHSLTHSHWLFASFFHSTNIIISQSEQ